MERMREITCKGLPEWCPLLPVDRVESLPVFRSVELFVRQKKKMWKIESFPDDGFPLSDTTVLPTRTGGLSTLLRCKGEKGCNFPVSLCLNLLRFLYKEITLIKSPFCCMKDAGWLMFDFGWDWIWEKILTWNNTSYFYNPGLPRVLA